MDNPAAESVDASQMQALMDETMESLSRDLPNGMPPRYFDEEFDLDLEFEKYEKIETPDFTNGRKGRFVHDFGKVRVQIAVCSSIFDNATPLLTRMQTNDTKMTHMMPIGFFPTISVCFCAY